MNLIVKKFHHLRFLKVVILGSFTIGNFFLDFKAFAFRGKLMDLVSFDQNVDFYFAKIIGNAA